MGTTRIAPDEITDPTSDAVASGELTVVSWNINGLRAGLKRGFLEWLDGCGADVVALQETRCRADQLPAGVLDHKGWHCALVAAERPGYSGVGLFSRHPIETLDVTLGQRFDAEGRVQLVATGGVVVANVYFPHGAGRNRDNSRIPYKIAFYKALREKLEPYLDAAAPTLVVGDFNTSHRMIDLARPKQNKGTSGFTPRERRALTKWLSTGWTDVFREQHRGEAGHYTWWATRSQCRERNIGWRIDYALANPSATAATTDAFIWPQVMGSDHCPLGVSLRLPSS